MFAGPHVAVRITMLLLPGLLYAAPAMSEGERVLKVFSLQQHATAARAPELWRIGSVRNNPLR